MACYNRTSDDKKEGSIFLQVFCAQYGTCCKAWSADMTQRQSSTCNMPIFTKKFSFGDSFVFATCCIIFSLQFEFVFSHEAGKNGVDFQCRNVFTVLANCLCYSREMIIFPSSLVSDILFTRIYFLPASALVNLRPSQMFTQM